MVWKNLLSYDSEKLEEVDIDGTEYLADPDYRPEAVIGQAFGADMDEGSYNQVLADTIEDAQSFYDEDLEVFVQKEVAECMQEMMREGAIVAGETYADDETAMAVSKYSTKEMFELHHENVMREDLDPESVLYVAHPAHMERVKGIGDNIGFEGRPFISSEVEWPSDDNQLWVKSPLLWGPRELAARSFRKLRGEM